MGAPLTPGKYAAVSAPSMAPTVHGFMRGTRSRSMASLTDRKKNPRRTAEEASRKPAVLARPTPPCIEPHREQDQDLHSPVAAPRNPRRARARLDRLDDAAEICIVTARP